MSRPSFPSEAAGLTVPVRPLRPTNLGVVPTMTTAPSALKVGPPLVGVGGYGDCLTDHSSLA